MTPPALGFRAGDGQPAIDAQNLSGGVGDFAPGQDGGGASQACGVPQRFSRVKPAAMSRSYFSLAPAVMSVATMPVRISSKRQCPNWADRAPPTTASPWRCPHWRCNNRRDRPTPSSRSPTILGAGELLCQSIEASKYRRI